jgi:4-hydroxy-2,2'-bipyrrole-5-carbaldehyde O-methyltransferase
MNLRYTLSFLNTMKIPGLYPILKDWQAFVRMHFLFAAYESGLLNALVTPRKKSMLIKELGVKRPELLDALLDVGLATKELELRENLTSAPISRFRGVETERNRFRISTLVW